MQDLSSFPAARRRGPGRYLPLALLLAAAAPFAAQAQTGGVGIGTTAPDVSAALDIVSSSKGALLPRVADATAIATPATGLLVFQTGGTPGFYYNAGTPAAPSWQQIATAAGAAITASNGLTRTGQNIALGGTLTQATDVATNGNNFTLSGTGNVGIGTSSPAARLDVAGSGVLATQLRVDGSSANTGTFPGFSIGQPRPALFNGLLFGDDGSGEGIGSSRSGTTNAAGLDFYTYYTPRLSITNGGSVGIGTSSPGQRLTVAGGIAATGGEQIRTQGAHLQWNRNNGDGETWLLNQRGLGVGGIRFGASDAVSGVANTVTEWARFDNSGNLGIGTSTPGQKLTVAGQVFSTSGGFRFPDNTVQTTAAVGDNLGNHSATQSLFLNDFDLRLRYGNDNAHGLGYYGTSGANKPWNGVNVDGPVLYGFAGGVLGTYNGGQQQSVLTWNIAGRVGIGTSTPGQKLEVAGQVFSSTGGFRFPDNTVQTTAATTPPAITASNGLTRTANDLALGGTLTQNTTLTQNGNSLSLAGSPAAATISQPTSSGSLTISAGAGSDGQGQSFVLPAGATVTQVDVYGDGGGTTHTFTFYQGVPGGTVLGTQSVTYGPGQSLVSVVLATPITVGAAGTYSFSTGSPNAFLVSYSNPYAGGTRFSGTTASASDDMKFTVYYTAPAPTLYASGSGQVGIGTSAPTQALQVAGQVYSSTGGFRFPDNTVQTTAASGTGFIQNTTTPQAGSNFNVSGNGTVGGTLTAASAAVAGALTGNGASLGTAVGLGVQANGGLNIGQNTTGNNVFVGYAAGNNSTTGIYNQFVGYGSGNANTAGAKNTFSGYGSGNVNAGGNFNTFEGYQSGLANTSGNSNTFSGAGAGLFNTTGSSNTVLGYNSGPASGSGDLANATALGANVVLTTSNTVVLGNGANVGIGTSAPAGGLHVLTGTSGVGSGVTGAVLSGPPTGNPNLELRGGSTAVTPYIDFAETNTVDYTTRLRSIGGVLNVEGGGSGGLLLRVNGSIQASNVTFTSDRRFKQNVRPLAGALAAVLALRGVRYEWNALGVRHGGTAGAGQVGLIAQELEKLYPELVLTDGEGYKSVNYAQLTPVLIEALKEQQAQIEALKTQNATLKAEATATTEAFEARLRRLEAATDGQAQR